MALDEGDLRRLLASAETTFVERKSINDGRDWIKTVVAFANTLSLEQEGVLFLGVTDQGHIQDVADLDELQKSFVKKTRDIYPECPPYTAREVSYEHKVCLAIIVRGGNRKPYFAGPPYLRVASTSVVASPDQFENLLSTRSDKAYFLQQWIGKLVTIRKTFRSAGMGYNLNQTELEAKVTECTRFYITVFLNNALWSYPLTRCEVSFDHRRGRVEIQLENPPQ